MTPEINHRGWRKSSSSGGTNGDCIELTNMLDAVRDSKNPAGPTLRVDVAGLISACRTGRLDR